MTNKKKILIIKLGAIGDVIHSTVIATSIKQIYPNWEIHFLTSTSIAPMLNDHPHIDKIIEWDNTKRKSFKYLFKIITQLFKEHYEVIFNPTRATRNYLLSYLAFPKKVINKKKHPEVSWVEEYFASAKNIFKDLTLPNRLYLGHNKIAEEKIKKDIKPLSRPIVVLSPGGEADLNREGRTWSLDSWQKLIDILNQNKINVIISGSKKERDYHLNLKQATILSGNYNLAETTALLANADLVIAGDTGPAHIAAATGTNTISLLGSTSPDKIKPFGENGYFVASPNQCRFCWSKKCKFTEFSNKTTPCMQAITPEIVINKIKELSLLPLDK